MAIPNGRCLFLQHLSILPALLFSSLYLITTAECLLSLQGPVASVGGFLTFENFSI
ncbi:hypothetical protein LINPERHAP2_LOCUS23838, partial [Linum perenne]